MGDVLKNHSVLVNGRRYEIKPLKRYLLSNGERYDIEEVAKKQSGVIVGEGDVGKSTYAKMLVEKARKNGSAKIVRFRSLEANSQILAELNAAIASSAEGKRSTIIFDGLDERREAAQPLIDAIVDTDCLPVCNVWVTSRPGEEVSRLMDSGCFESLYELEPFTEYDAARIAGQIGIDRCEFFDAAQKVTGTASFLRKPGGAVLMLELFAAGKLKSGS